MPAPPSLSEEHRVCRSLYVIYFPSFRKPSAPILPTGYIGMVDMVMGKNHTFQQYAVRELERRELGPFSPETEPEEADLARETARKILDHTPPPDPGLFGPNAEGERGARVIAPRIAILAGVLLVLTAGVQFENPEALSFFARFALNAWIVGAFIVMIQVYRRLGDAELGESMRLCAAMGTLFLIGSITANAIGF